MDQDAAKPVMIASPVQVSAVHLVKYHAARRAATTLPLEFAAREAVMHGVAIRAIPAAVRAIATMKALNVVVKMGAARKKIPVANWSVASPLLTVGPMASALPCPSVPRLLQLRALSVPPSQTLLQSTKKRSRKRKASPNSNARKRQSPMMREQL